MSTQENQEVTLVSSKKERKRKAQYCDLEGHGNVACDYEQHGALSYLRKSRYQVRVNILNLSEKLCVKDITTS